MGRLSPMQEPLTTRLLARAAPKATRVIVQAARRIEQREVPEEGRALARPFLRDVRALRGQVAKLGDAARIEDTEGTGRAVKAIHELLPRLGRHARAAGAVKCADTKAFETALDAVRTPMFVYALDRVIPDLAELPAVLADLEPDRPVATANALADASEVVDDAHTRMYGVDWPHWVRRPLQRYLSALEDVDQAILVIWDAYDTQLLRAATAKEVQPQKERGARRLIRAGRRERRAAVRLQQAIREHVNRARTPQPPRT